MNISQKNKKFYLVLLDAITISCSLLLSFLLRFDFEFPVQFQNEMLLLLLVSIFIQISIFSILRYYDVIWRFTSIWDMLNIFRAVTFSSLLSIVFILFYKGTFFYPRTVLLLFYILNVATTCITRVLVRLYFTHFSFSSKNNINKKSLILIGAGKTGEKITREIKSSINSKYDIVGFFDDNPEIQGSSIHGIKILGTVKDILKINNIFDEILITAPSASGDQLRKIIKICKKSGKKYKTVPGILEFIDGDKITIDAIRNVSYVDLLGRKEVKLDLDSIHKIIIGKRIMISGAGGSIGSELVRQCLVFKPAEIICIDNSEENIFNLESELGAKSRLGSIIKYHLCTINSKTELEKIFNENRPQIIFHAAAYKHVPIQEKHPWSAVKTNVGGTLNMVNFADKYSVDLFILVSTDKAVNPVNVMGASKRTAEKIIQSFNVQSKTSFMAVRFGNVLGSSGSAIPIFEKQISNGGPITITHPEMTRYFMSIQEATQLILQCSAIGKQGEIFLLEMGKPVKILQMAKDLIRLSGLEPDIDIPIVFTGLRPGEKLYEELQLKDEIKINTEHKKIMILSGLQEIKHWEALLREIQMLLLASDEIDLEKIQKYFKIIVPTYFPRNLRRIDNFTDEKYHAEA